MTVVSGLTAEYDIVGMHMQRTKNFFKNYQLTAFKLSSQILSGAAVFNDMKQKWKIT